MLRTSSKNHDVYVTPKNEQIEKLSRFEKIELFDKLTIEAVAAGKAYLAQKRQRTNAIILQEDNLRADFVFMRAFYKLVHLYPLLKTALEKNPMTRLEIPANNVSDFYKKLGLTDISARCDNQPTDINHITKLANRYHLDFDQAFNFWVLTNAMRTDFKYSSKGEVRLSTVVDKITAAQLIAIGKKATLTEEQVKELLPAIGVKLNVSCVKNVLGRHKQGLFATNASFNEALSSVIPTNQSRLNI